MKCECVQAIWARDALPPLQREVVAAAVVDDEDPSSLYTGALDGSIVWWKIMPSSSSSSRLDVIPIALLCGHAVALADMQICFPFGNNKATEKLNESHKAMISVSVDGVLCMWSCYTGHCKKRRKLPPWIGSPTKISILPESHQYFCIASFGNSNMQSEESPSSETSTKQIAEESKSKVMSKGVIAIVDSLNLNITQVLFHGILSIGTVKSLTTVTDIGNGNIVLASDRFGNVQTFTFSNLNNKANESRDQTVGIISTPMQNACSTSTDAVDNELKDTIIAYDGNLVLSVLIDRWMLRSTRTGSTVIDVSCADSFLCRGSTSATTLLDGGSFLSKGPHELDNFVDMHHKRLATVLIWNNEGAAIIYAVLEIWSANHAIPLFGVPPVMLPSEGLLNFTFKQLNEFVIRIESTKADCDTSLFRETVVTIWSLPCYTSENSLNNFKLQENAFTYSGLNDENMAMLFGIGGFWRQCRQPSFEHSSSSSFRTNSNGKIDYDNLDILQRPNLVSDVNYREHDMVAEKYSKITTASMILSDKSSVPDALICGCLNGKIKYIKLRSNAEDSWIMKGKVEQPRNASGGLKLFDAHTGPVTCLASKSIHVNGNGHESMPWLVSGGQDCTICVWNLESGNLLYVLHQHVTPVKELVFPSSFTDFPWLNCILTISEDGCMSLVSLETLKVERMFPGYCGSPVAVVWDGVRGYIACLYKVTPGLSGSDVLYIWDVKSGACERVLCGSSAHSFFDQFYRSVHLRGTLNRGSDGSTSASSLHLHYDWNGCHYNDCEVKLYVDRMTDIHLSSSAPNKSKSKLHTKLLLSKDAQVRSEGANVSLPLKFEDSVGCERSSAKSNLNTQQKTISGVCPFPGVAALRFELSSLIAALAAGAFDMSITENKPMKDTSVTKPKDYNGTQSSSSANGYWSEQKTWLDTDEGHSIQLGLSFLHLWGVDKQLDELLSQEMKISKPKHFESSVGLVGDSDSLTLFLPRQSATYELWKASSEFYSMRLLAMVSLAQCMVSLAGSSSALSSAITSFYTQDVLEILADIKPPSLELYMCFWHDASEHVRMAARTLFHSSASCSVLSLHQQEASINNMSSGDISNSEQTRVPKEKLPPEDLRYSMFHRFKKENINDKQVDISGWLDSCEGHDWTSLIGATDRDVKASRVNVSAALAIWYAEHISKKLAAAASAELVKLVVTVNGRHSATAAELLAEGLDNTWQSQPGLDLPHLVNDIFLLIDCLSEITANAGSKENVGVEITMKETLVEILLPRLAMANVSAFLHAVENHARTMRRNSMIHLMSLNTLTRIIRVEPKALVPCLDKVTEYILRTLYISNPLRKACEQTSMAVIREMARVFPMVALDESLSRLAVGDAIGDIRTLSIRVYDLHSVTKLKILDASGPFHFPSLLPGDENMENRGGISALSFCPDREGLVAFSFHGLMIRWWSLETPWWEKLSKSTVPVQCTKLILLPPLEGLSPESSMSSIMANIASGRCSNGSQVTQKEGDARPRKKTALNIDLAYRLQWVSTKQVVLMLNGEEMGSFQL